MRKTLLLLSALTLVGCSSDQTSIAGPDAAACTAGVLNIGQTKTGVTSASDCKFYDTAYFDDTLYYDSYSVQLEAGRSYVFYARDLAADDENLRHDMGLSLVGEGGTVGVSDDDGGGYYGTDSQLAFVAPVSGVYSLRVHGYSQTDTGGYSVTARSCGAAPTVTDVLTSGTIGSGDCIVHYLAEASSYVDSTRVDFYQVTLANNQSINIRVQSSAFRPLVYIGGPGFDAQESLIDGSYDYRYGASPVSLTFTAPAAGQYTIMVGPDPNSAGFATGGAYSIDLEPVVATVRASRASSPVVRKPKG